MECTEMDTEVVEYYTTLILKLNIKDVQNPFQRQYHRDQTELFFLINFIRRHRLNHARAMKFLKAGIRLKTE